MEVKEDMSAASITASIIPFRPATIAVDVSGGEIFGGVKKIKPLQNQKSKLPWGITSNTSLM